jgi:hypothetical protein
VLRNVEQLRLNLGIFSLHVVQMAIFVVVPVALVTHSGVPLAEHWKIYLPVVLGSFALMAPAVVYADRAARLKAVFTASVALLLAVQVGIALLLENFAGLVVMLLLFFVAFNILEASLPSLVSRMAPASARGTAIGVYNTTQSLGLFCGGALGGWLAQHYGAQSVFACGGALVAVWLALATTMKHPAVIASRAIRVEPFTNADSLAHELAGAPGATAAAGGANQGAARMK